jgi:RHS repeat-associated protein
VNTYTWDSANRLLSMGGASYLYDGLGNRIQQTVGANITQYLIDQQPGLAMLLTATTGANVTRYVHAPAGGAEQPPSGAWVWKVPDGLGSVRGVVDNSVTSLESRLYSPYGEPYGPTGTSQTVFGFTGEETDGTGLVNLRARYYNPTIGQFFSLDPLEMPNRYRYADANPSNMVDPSGWVAQQDIATMTQWTSCLAQGIGNIQSAWSCVAHHPSTFYSHWLCEGPGCQKWMDEAFCVLVHGTPSHPPTSFTQQYAINVMLFNSNRSFDVSWQGLGVWVHLTQGSNSLRDKILSALTPANTSFITDRNNMYLPQSYLNDNDFQSFQFLSHVGLMAHEYWHTTQLYGLGTITGSLYDELEAYNIQTALYKDLGVLNSSSNSNQLLFLLSLGLPKPYGTGVTRDTCRLCQARHIIKSFSPNYGNLPLITAPIPVFPSECDKYLQIGAISQNTPYYCP